MNYNIRFKKSITTSSTISISKDADYCKNYFAAQNKIVKKAIFGKRQLQIS